MHVLEEVQRERPRPVEEEYVAFLEIVEAALAELGGEPAKRAAPPLGSRPSSSRTAAKDGAAARISSVG